MKRKLYAVSYVEGLELKAKEKHELPEKAGMLMKAFVGFIEDNDDQERFEAYLKRNYPELVGGNL